VILDCSEEITYILRTEEGPGNDQFVILDPSEEITYFLRAEEGHEKVSL
jgi:hypothetical protein